MRIMRRRWLNRARPLAVSMVLAVALLLPDAASFPAPTPVVAGIPPGGAPPAGSGTKQTPPYVRVIDGNTIETLIDGKQVGVKFIGIDVPQGNTACGREATNQLRALVKGGSLTLEEDDTAAFDASTLRLYHGRTKDGRAIAQELVRAGVATVNGTGDAKRRFTAEEADARAAKRGCVWSGGQSKTGGAVAPRQAVAGAADTDSFRAVPAPPAGASEQPGAIALPGGFAQQTVIGGLNTPTAFAFVPDGRLFVTEKPGTVRVVKNGTLLATPLIDLTAKVNDYWDRGLLGIAVDPNFAQNSYVYLLYVYENNAAQYDGGKTARLARYTVSGDTAAPASEQVILGTQVGSSCTTGNDCIGSENPSHSVGNVKFASDGTMFVTAGDAASFNVVDDNALRAQNLDSLNGKVLRITTAGQGLATNPFWDGNAAHSRSKVWAYGLRNPFRFGLRPGTDIPYVGDVGWNDWEELDVGAKGANLGWPCYEGTFQQDGYAPKTACQTLYAQGTGAVRFGLATWDHQPNGQYSSSAAVGGTFYTGTAFPAAYQGAYLYGDYGQGFIRSLTVNASDALTGGPTDFATAVDAPVDIQQGADGALYFVAINNGEIRKIVYTGGGPTPPAIPTGLGATPGDAQVTLNWAANGEADLAGYNIFRGAASPVGTAGTPLNGGMPVTARTYTDTGLTNGTTYYYAIQAVNTSGQKSAASATVGATPRASGASGCPDGQFAASYFANKTLSGTAVQGACITTLNYSTEGATPNWPGDTVAGIGPSNFSARWTGQFTFAAGTFTFTATADDGIRLFIDGASTPLINGWLDQAPTTYTANATLAAGAHTVTVEYYQAAGGATAQASWQQVGGGTPPTATIATPSASLTYKVGDTIAFSGSGRDGNGQALPATALRWDVVIHHCPGGNCHTHYLLQNVPGATGSFTVPDHGDDSYFELILTATDGGGRTGTASVSVRPQTVQVTLATTPPGLSVIYTGATYTAPATFTTIPGSLRTIQVASPQGAQTFAGWSDGGAQQHDITVGAGNATYTATFTPSGSPDFTLGMTPGSQSIAQGGSATYTASVTATGGFSGAVSLAATGLPTGATGSFSPASVTGSGMATLTVATGSATPAGSYPLTITGTSGGVSHTASVTLAVTASGGGLPSPWADRDIGGVAAAGGATFSGGTFTVVGSGADIWDNADGFHYAYQPLNGDGQIVARVASITNTDGWAKAGVMIRESLTAGSKHAAMVVTPGNGSGFQRRTATNGASATTAGPGVTAPYWVRLVRSGSTFTGSVSSDGATWVTVGTATITMATAAYVGLPVTAHNNGALNTATFTDVSVAATTPPIPDFTLAATPGSQGIAQGGSTSYTVTTTATGGFSGVVSLAATGLPAGAAGTFSPTTLAGSGSATLTVAAGAGTPVGSYPLTITGTSGSLSHAASVTLAVTASGGTPPAAPTGLAATAGDGSVSLRWSANAEPNIAGYNVFRGAASPVGTTGTPLNGATPLTATTYTDAGLTNGTTYYYAVQAVSTAGQKSPASATVVATPQASGGTTCPTGQFLAQYYANKTLTGTPKKTQCEAAITYSTEDITPTWGKDIVPSQTNFSVRWTGQFTFAAGQFTFTATGDDGIRMFVDGVRIINGWKNQAPTTYTENRTLTAGTHTVTVEYYQATGGATAKVSWPQSTTTSAHPDDPLPPPDTPQPRAAPDAADDDPAPLPTPR